MFGFSCFNYPVINFFGEFHHLIWNGVSAFVLILSPGGIYGSKLEGLANSSNGYRNRTKTPCDNLERGLYARFRTELEKMQVKVKNPTP